MNLIVKGFGVADPRSAAYIEELQSWMRELVPDWTQADIEHESVRWKDLSGEKQLEQLRFLRAVKMRLKIAEELQQCGLQPEPRIAGLIPFWKLLP